MKKHSVITGIATTFTFFALFILLTSVTLAAWNPPASNPPSGNTDIPINVGGSGQIKEGGLTVATDSVGIGFVVLNGNVGIGTDTPGAKLHVEGNLRIDGALIFQNNTRITSAPPNCPSGLGWNGSSWTC